MLFANDVNLIDETHDGIKLSYKFWERSYSLKVLAIAKPR